MTTQPGPTEADRPRNEPTDRTVYLPVKVTMEGLYDAPMGPYFKGLVQFAESSHPLTYSISESLVVDASAHDARIRAEALHEAADALALLPPMLRDQYVNLLRLYAEEPWRLQDEMEGIDIAHIQTDHGCVISVNGQGHLPCSEHRAAAEVTE